MEESKNAITEKLTSIVRQRRTPVVITKQENTYKKPRRFRKSLTSESFSYDGDD